HLLVRGRRNEENSASGRRDMLILTLGDLFLDDARFELRCGAERVFVQWKVLQVLMHLAANPGRMVTTDELLRVVWSGETVTGASIRKAIRGAHKALGDDGGSQS